MSIENSFLNRQMTILILTQQFHLFLLSNLKIHLLKPNSAWPDEVSMRTHDFYQLEDEKKTNKIENEFLAKQELYLKRHQRSYDYVFDWIGWVDPQEQFFLIVPLTSRRVADYFGRILKKKNIPL